MRKRVIRLAVACFAVAVLGSIGAREAEAAGCPSHLTDGSTVCHHTSGTDCNSCRYKCSDGESYTWTVCNVT